MAKYPKIKFRPKRETTTNLLAIGVNRMMNPRLLQDKITIFFHEIFFPLISQWARKFKKEQAKKLVKLYETNKIFS